MTNKIDFHFFENFRSLIKLNTFFQNSSFLPLLTAFLSFGQFSFTFASPSLVPYFSDSASNIFLSRKVEKQKKFKVGFILLHPKGIPDSLFTANWYHLEKLRARLASDFYTATEGLATLDTDSFITTVQGKLNSSETMLDLSPDQLIVVVKEFYESASDDYDFLAIYPIHPTAPDNAAWYSFKTANSAYGIGHSYYIGDYSKRSAIKSDQLRSFILMEQVYNPNLIEEIQESTRWSEQEKQERIEALLQDRTSTQVRGFLHEIGHHWCCYLGSPFTGEKDSSAITIRTVASHFHSGLDSPTTSPTPMGAGPWEPNGDGTFSRREFDPSQPPVYHPIQLYFMGLLPESRYRDTYNIYDNTNHTGNNPDKTTKTTYWGNISVNAIISMAGQRMDYRSHLKNIQATWTDRTNEILVVISEDSQTNEQFFSVFDFVHNKWLNLEVALPASAPRNISSGFLHEPSRQLVLLSQQRFTYSIYNLIEKKWTVFEAPQPASFPRDITAVEVLPHSNSLLIFSQDDQAALTYSIFDLAAGTWPIFEEPLVKPEEFGIPSNIVGMYLHNVSSPSRPAKERLYIIGSNGASYKIFDAEESWVTPERPLHMGWPFL